MIDNFSQTCIDLCQYIQNNAPHGMQPIDLLGNRNYYSLRFSQNEKNYNECTLMIVMDRQGELKTDPAGNQWSTSRIGVSFSWASWSDKPLDICSKRLSYFQEILAFGRDIEDKFGWIEICRLNRMADELSFVRKDLSHGVGY